MPEKPKLKKATGWSRVGTGATFERTNPDYVEEHIARLARQYYECPRAWRREFLAGLDYRDRWELKKRGIK